MSNPILEARDIYKYFPIKKGFIRKKEVGAVKAVDGVSFALNEGETLGLIGESGCGKTTVSRVVMRLMPETSGSVLYEGQPITPENILKYRQQVQMVFQDPYLSIDPRMKIEHIVTEGLRIHTNMTRKERRAAIMPIMERIGLGEDALEKYPHEFSGGQRQRIGIARALALNPKVLICDEPVSALDVSVQASILNLFAELQRERNLSYLFISHDMSVVRHVSNRIAVMYLGRIVEIAEKKELFDNPLHPYTEALMSAIPVPDPHMRTERKLLAGDPPSPINPPPGCPFQTRCDRVCDICRTTPPQMRSITPTHSVACHLYDKEG